MTYGYHAHHGKSCELGHERVYNTLSPSRYSLGHKQLIVEPRFTQGEYMSITPYTNTRLITSYDKVLEEY